MAFKLPNNVQETTTTTGTGPITVLGPATGARAFSSQLSNADTTILVIKDDIDEECCYATYTSASNSFTRDSVIWSTNSNALVNWTSGTRDVIAALPGNVMEALLDPNAFTIAKAATFSQDVTMGANAASICTPSAEAFAATQVIDLSKSSVKSLTVTSNFTAAAGITTSFRVAGAMALIRMVASGGPYNFPTSGVGFFSDWRWIGAKPTTLAANKIGVLALTCFGPNETDIVASWSFET